MKTFKTLAACGLLISGALLSGCGGSSSDDDSSDDSSDSYVTQSISGPLDVLQEPISTQVFDNLETGLSGTPLEGLLGCVDQLLVNDVLDVVDGLLVDISNGALDPDSDTGFSASLPDVRGAVSNLVTNLQGLQYSLTGGDCALPEGDGSSPLAGTPLAPLGEVLSSLPLVPEDGGFPALGEYLQNLQQRLQGALESLPLGDREDVSVPVLSGLLDTLNTALLDLTVTVASVTSGDPESVQYSISQTLNHLLTNVLTKVVPISDIEAATGQEGLVSGRISDAITQLTTLLGGDLAARLNGDFTSEAPNLLGNLLDALNLTVIPSILGELGSAITSGEGLPETGTPLDAVLTPLSALAERLTGGFDGDGLTGTPLDILLDPIANLLNGTGSCPVAETPLEALCSVVDGLTSALTENPDANPLSLLTGLLENLLGFLI